MKEYIDKENLMEFLREAADQYGLMESREGADTVNELMFLIEEDFPKSDMVEIVRCKDCVRRYSCKIISGIWGYRTRDWFCADGIKYEET